MEKTDASMDDLFDDEIISQILARVPGQQVISLKVINKRWNSLISSNFFVRRFNSINRLVSGLFHHSSVDAHIISFFSLDVDGNGTRSCRNFLATDDKGLIVLPKTTQYSYQDLKANVLASSNGLLLIRSKEIYYVCNPLTFRSQPITLPWPSSEGDSILTPRFGLVVNSIGEPAKFSSRNNLSNYKVICVYRLKREPNIFRFVIFSRETMEWRLSSYAINHGRGEIFEMHNAVYHRGALHWLSSTYILAFHVGKERSWEIELPTNMEIHCNRRLSNTWFGIVEETINLLSISEEKITVWVLEDNEKSKWQIKRRIMKTWGNLISNKISNVPIFYDGEQLAFGFYDTKKGRSVLIQNISTGVQKTKPLEGWMNGIRKYIPYTSTLMAV